MKVNQQTIQRSISLSGAGLHTGQHATVSFLPAAPDTGIRLVRTDMHHQPVVIADADHVIGTARGTSLGNGNAVIHTVEHVLAAAAGLEIDNLLIEMDGPEIPILDGSALPFVLALEEAGVIDQGVPKDYFEVPEAITFEDESSGSYLSIAPADTLQMLVKIDFDSPVLKAREARLDAIAQFKDRIAPCRTFCFLHELEHLYKAGKIKGGDLSNAVVIVDRKVERNELDHLADLLGKPSVEPQEAGILNNTQLRFPDEPVRHKLLDVMGDLALLGRPVKGSITAFKPGHAANIAFVRKLKKIMRKIVREQI